MDIDKYISYMRPDNPLVILLPISEYESPFSRLQGVKYDTIANRRFWSSVGYQIFPSRDDYVVNTKFSPRLRSIPP